MLRLLRTRRVKELLLLPSPLLTMDRDLLVFQQRDRQSQIQRIQFLPVKDWSEDVLMMKPLRRIWSIFLTRWPGLATEMLGLKPRATNTLHSRSVPSFSWKWRKPPKHILALMSNRLLSLYQLISMILRDKLPRMLVRLLILRLIELSMNQQLPLLHSVSTRPTERSLPSTTLVVELSIFQSLKFLEVFLRLKPLMVTLHSVEKILISSWWNS